MTGFIIVSALAILSVIVAAIVIWCDMRHENDEALDDLSRELRELIERDRENEAEAGSLPSHQGAGRHFQRHGSVVGAD